MKNFKHLRLVNQPTRGFTLTFCLGATTGGLAAGARTATQAGTN